MKLEYLLLFLAVVVFFCYQNKEQFMDFEYTKTFNWDFMDNNVPEKLHNQGLIHPLDEIAMWVETHYNKHIKDANNMSVNREIDEVIETFPGEKKFGKWTYKMGHFLSEDDRLRSLKGLLRTKGKLYNTWTLQTDDYKKVETVVTNYNYQILGVFKPAYLTMQFDQLKKIAKMHSNTFIENKIDVLLGLQKDLPQNWRFILNRYNPHMCLSKPGITDAHIALNSDSNYANEFVCGELEPNKQLWSVIGNKIISKDDPSQCLTRDICHNKIAKCSTNPNQEWAFRKDGSFYHKMDEHECDDDGRYVFEKARY